MLDKEVLKELIVNTVPSARYASGKKHIVMRCNMCGDSDNPKSAHMYVLFDDDRPIIKYCQKCKGSGVVNHNTLVEWGIYDPGVNVDLINYNKLVMGKQDNFKYVDKQIYTLSNNYITDNQRSRYKLSYINNRIGLNLSYKDLLDMKIVLNIGDLLDSNNIHSYTRDQSIMQQLDEYFIGFISHDNAFINMRNLNEGHVYKSIDTRYINYNIFNKFNNEQRYYTIPTNIDLNNPKRIKLHIAEGPFDILSIYYNLRNKEKHSIYAAIGGSGYLNLIKNFILNMKLIYLEVHVYLDNDIKDYIIRDIKNYLNLYNIPLLIHRNMKSGEKDFGVCIGQIEERVEMI